MRRLAPQGVAHTFTNQRSGLIRSIGHEEEDARRKRRCCIQEATSTTHVDVLTTTMEKKIPKLKQGGVLTVHAAMPMRNVEGRTVIG